MHFFLQGACVVLLVVGGFSAQADENNGPVYQRYRAGAWYGAPSTQYRSSTHNGRRPGGTHGNQPEESVGSQQSSGNWFTRPYPYHFDYYRGRYSGRRVVAKASDCPCASETTRLQE